MLKLVFLLQSDVNTVCFADESGHLIYSGSDDNFCKVALHLPSLSIKSLEIVALSAVLLIEQFIVNTTRDFKYIINHEGLYLRQSDTKSYVVGILYQLDSYFFSLFGSFYVMCCVQNMHLVAH